MNVDIGISLLKSGGLYRQVRDPSDEEITAADVAYLGGHVYEITGTESDALIAAGYGSQIIVPPEEPTAGFGVGTFGAGTFGGS